MTLTFTDKFKLNINDDTTVLEGTYRPLTKAEQKQITAKYQHVIDVQKKINKKLQDSQKIQSKLEILMSRAKLDQVIKYHEAIERGENEEDAKVKFDDTKKSIDYLNKLEKANNEIFKIRDEIADLAEDIDGADIEEKIAIDTLYACVKTEQQDLLNQCIETVGIQKVMKAIIEAVSEGKSKGTKNS